MALPYSHLLAYATPWAAYMAASLPITLWFGKFATDTLAIPAGAMGAMVMTARVWDGISDPVAGYLSDRTVSPRGRRLSWMTASALPIALALVALWSPPQAMEGIALILWMGAAYILWETASTALIVPYIALGNELTEDYHERTRLFAWRHALSILGYPIGLGLVYLLRTSAQSSAADGRTMAFALGVVGAVLLASAILGAVRALPEPADHQRRGGDRVWPAFADVFRNPHARVLLLVYAVESFGMGSISFLVPYALEDVLGRLDYLELVLMAWIIPQFAFTPLWLRLARHTSKKTLWIGAMILYAIAFTTNLAIPALGLPFLFVVVFILGIGGGVSNIVAPSVQADVIDWDELQTGERKEGAYTAVWNLIRKSGWGIAAGVGGLALGAAGYDGEAEAQTETVKWTIVLLVSVLPGVAYAISALVMSRFSLNQEEHARVLAEIRSRRQADA